MWIGLAPIGPGSGRVIYEGVDAALVTIHNAGPSSIEIRAWADAPPESPKPDFRMRVWAGGTRAIQGRTISVLLESDNTSLPTEVKFAAVGWNIR